VPGNVQGTPGAARVEAARRVSACGALSS
jgi:hypothetical protein